MSLITFWCGVAVWSVFGLGYLIGLEVELRARLLEQARGAAVACPVGDIAGMPHTFRRGSGVVVDWCVMGMSSSSVEVCSGCYHGGDL